MIRRALLPCKVNILGVLLFVAAFFPAGSQRLFDEDFETYLEYGSVLLSEYMNANEPYFDEYLEKSGKDLDECMEAIKPYMDRLIDDPNYTYEDYLSDTREYSEKMRRKISEYSKEYKERSRPMYNAYREASAALRESYYAAGGARGLTQAEFDRLMREFRSRVKEALKGTAPSGTAPPPVPGNTAVIKRMNRYAARTGFHNRKLLNLYASADINGNDELSFYELEQFQRRLINNYNYITNNTALTPEEFLASCGGDCEDWAIVTAGLLRFWDVPAYVGTLSQPTGGIGHAVCLIKTDRPPEGYTCWEVTGSYNLDGLYVPVDYDRVGALSTPLLNEWLLTNIYKPEEIYGMWM